MKRSVKIKLSWIVMACLVMAGILAGLYVLGYRGRINAKVSQYKGTEYLASDKVRDDIMTAQEFIPKESYLEAIGLRLLTNPAEDNAAGLYLTLVDYNGEAIANVSTLLSMMPRDDYYYFYTNISVKPGERYHILLQTADCYGQYPTLAAYTSDMGKVNENGYYTYDGEIAGDSRLAVSYKYQVPVSDKMILILLGIVFAVTGAAVLLTGYYFIKKNKDKTFEVGPDSLLKWAPVLEKRQRLIFLIVVGIFGIIYLSLCFNNNVWTDEAYVIDLLKKCDTFKEVFDFSATGVNPPLYFMILMPFTNLFGINLLMLKILSIVPVLLTMALGEFYIRKRFGFKTALLYILMIGTIPMTMEYAVQVRMYSWAIFFLTACAFAAYDIYKTDRIRSYVIMGLCGVACFHTQYFAFASALWIYGILFLFLLFARKGKNKKISLAKWALMCVGSVVISIPWLLKMLAQVKQVSETYWIPPMTKKVALSFLGSFFEADLPYSVIMYQCMFVVAMVYAVVMLVQAVRSKNITGRNEIITVSLGFAVQILTIVTGVVLSKLIRPIFVIRYALPCVALLSLFFAYVMSRMGKKIYVTIVAFCLFVGVIDYKSEYYTEYESTLVHEMDAFFEEHLGENDYVVYNYKLFDFIYEYYFDNDILIYLADMDWAAEFETVWFLDTSYNPDISEETISEYGLDIHFVGNYSIEHNQFALYQIRK